MNLRDLFVYEKQTKNEFLIEESTSEQEKTYQKEEQTNENYLKKQVSSSSAQNIEYMKKIYSCPLNSDIVFREFELFFDDKAYPSFAMFIDGMVDRSLISQAIISPILSIPRFDDSVFDNSTLKDVVKKRLILANQLSEETQFEKITEAVNIGCCVLFIDTIDTCFIADVKMWEHRTISKSENEQTIEGPKEAFNEILRMNTALIRKTLNTQKLIIETYTVGSESKTLCALMYISDVANESLVKEARRRIGGVRVDYLISSEELMQFIQEKTFMPMPQMITTERPDRVARVLAEGRIAIMTHGSPSALIAPINFFELLYSSEDLYQQFLITNMIKMVRMLGIFLSVFLPGIYITLVLYHQEMIPSFLLYTIQSAQINVPFSPVIEIIIMEIAFELIREAGIRVPGPIGPTLGIIGALILGQASVAANIVSPVSIVVVATTGIGSFATTNYQLGLTLRLMRFAFIILASIGGILAMAFGLFIYLLILVSNTSFGVPIMAPIAPKTKHIFGDSFFILPIWKYEDRDDFLNSKKKKRQPEVSRAWSGRKDK